MFILHSHVLHNHNTSHVAHSTAQNGCDDDSILQFCIHGPAAYAAKSLLKNNLIFAVHASILTNCTFHLSVVLCIVCSSDDHILSLVLALVEYACTSNKLVLLSLVV